MPIEGALFLDDRLVFAEGDGLRLVDLESKEIMKRREGVFGSHVKVRGLVRMGEGKVLLFTERQYCVIDGETLQTEVMSG